MAGRTARTLLYSAGAFGLGTAGLVAYQKWSADATPDGLGPRAPQVFDPKAEVPPRAAQLATLRQGSRENPFDVLIIGGGATGTGCAVDAVSRWVKAHLTGAQTNGACMHSSAVSVSTSINASCRPHIKARQTCSSTLRSGRIPSVLRVQGPAHCTGGAAGLRVRHIVPLDQAGAP
jgi:hypothetical protein